MQTHPSPLPRSPEFSGTIPKQGNRFTNQENPLLTIVQDSPLSTLVLDEQSRILFANTAFTDFARRPLDQLIGQEIGKALQCGGLYQDDKRDFPRMDCSSCSLCNIHEKTAQTDCFEEDIHIHQLFGRLDTDLHIKAAPFQWGEHRFSVLFIQDMRHETRSLSFEKFIDEQIQQDLLRIREWMNELEYPSGIDKEALTKRIRYTLNTLLKSIQTDQIIRRAEKNELIPEINTFPIGDLFTDIYSNLEHLLTQRYCMLSLVLPERLSLIHTDRQLMEIILTHLVKTGLDSAKKDDTLKMGVEESKNGFDFYINRPQIIPANIQAQLFTPHFSTDQKGFGSYMIKLIVERVLGGNVQCESVTDQGTSFHIRIPKTLREPVDGKENKPE